MMRGEWAIPHILGHFSLIGLAAYIWKGSTGAKDNREVIKPVVILTVSGMHLHNYLSSYTE